MKQTLEPIVAAALDSLGLDLVELRIGGTRLRPLLDVRVDRRDLEKVTVADCAGASRATGHHPGRARRPRRQVTSMRRGTALGALGIVMVSTPLWTFSETPAELSTSSPAFRVAAVRFMPAERLRLFAAPQRLQDLLWCVVLPHLVIHEHREMRTRVEDISAANEPGERVPSKLNLRQLPPLGCGGVARRGHGGRKRSGGFEKIAPGPTPTRSRTVNC